MTIWHLHLLNSRNTLTLVMSEIRAAVRDAVTKANEHADVPSFDLVVRSGGNVIPEWGVGGMAPLPGVIQIDLNPDRFSAELFTRTLIHEFHHLIRWDGPGYGKSLGDALVSEGLAGHFVQQVLGGKPDPWDSVQPAPGLARRAMNEWARLDYDHARWFFGKGDLRKWAGYGLGYRLVAEHLAQNAGQDAATLANTRSEPFRNSLRRLIGADGAQETDEAEAQETAEPEEASLDLATLEPEVTDGKDAPVSEATAEPKGEQTDGEEQQPGGA